MANTDCAPIDEVRSSNHVVSSRCEWIRSIAGFNSCRSVSDMVLDTSTARRWSVTHKLSMGLMA